MYVQRYRAAPAGGRRSRDLRSQLVQPRRRRARHGFLTEMDGVEALPARSCRASSRPSSIPGIILIKYWLEVQRGGADAPPRGSHRRSAQDLEALADGPQVLQPLVRLLARARRHVRRHRFAARALVRRAERRQAARAPQRDPPPPRARCRTSRCSVEKIKFPKRQKRGGYLRNPNIQYKYVMPCIRHI